MTSQHSADSRLWIALACIFLVFLALLGGASRADEVSQLPIRIIAVLVMTVVVWQNPGNVLRQAQAPLIFAACCITLIVIQLVPLPYGLWSTLPGRSFYAELAGTLGVAGSARPLSLSPDLTIEAGLATLPALAGLLIALAVPVRDRGLLVYALLGVATIGALLGFAQVMQGTGSALRLYRITNADSMVGLFSNRNHHALLLACAIPMLFAVGSRRRDEDSKDRIIQALCFLVGIIFALTILLIGSRAGVILSVAGVVSGLIIAFSGQRSRRSRRSMSRRSQNLILAGAAVMVVGVIFAATRLDRVPALRRLLGVGEEEELRYQLFDPMIATAKAFLPLGSGFGTFDAVFRRFEPEALLRTSYLNQAHNDPLQLVIEGGLPAVALLVVFLMWWVFQSVRIWRLPRPSHDLIDLLPRIGSAVSGIQLLASVGDYPLRTPLHGVLFAICCSWMLMARPMGGRVSSSTYERATA